MVQEIPVPSTQLTAVEIEKLGRELWPSTDRREIWEWAADFVDFGNNAAFKGAYSIDNVPWTREILRSFKNPYVREITVVMPPQESGKTKAAEVCLCWRAVNSPAPMAFNPVTNVKAEQWADTRWKAMLIACPAVREKFSDNRFDEKKRRIIFRDGTFLIVQGAENDANRQSDSVEVQVNDEVNLWDKPWMKEMHNRLRAYEKSKKILNIGVGGKEQSEQQERFLEGNQLEWSHHCPECSGVFQYVFHHRDPKCNIKFDLNKVVQYSDGRLNLKEFEKSVHVVCPHCGHKMYWSEDLLRKLNRNGVYVPMNPDANPEIVSIHANSFAIGARPWFRILEPWVRLNLKGGVFATEILREFINQELAEFWKDRPMSVSKDIKLGTYTRAEMAKPGAWSDEWIRVMAIDNQHGAKGDVEHRWFVCRAFSRDGRSRLVDCGRINLWDDVRKKQRELGVPDYAPDRPGPWVAVDRRYNPTEVDQVCSRMRWFGLMGQDNDAYKHGKDSRWGEQQMLFSDEYVIDIGFGTADNGRDVCVYHYWSSQKVQDILGALRAGRAQSWELPADLHEFCPEYTDHISSHRQQMEVSKASGKERMVWTKIGGWPDHIYDCESELVVLGLMAGVFKKE